MPFSQQKLDQVTDGIRGTLSTGALNDWERKFLLDMLSRLERHGRNTTLSDKQYRKLMKLAGTETLSNSSPATPVKPSVNLRVINQPKRPRPQAAQRQYYRRSHFPWYIRKLTRDLKYLAFGGAIILVWGGINSLTGSGPTSLLERTTTSGEVQATQLSGRSIKVIDGDTVRVPGEPQRVRLVGFNTPEVFSPKCTRERQLGEQASQRLRQLLNNALSIEFKRVACSCKPGTEGTRACNYGRICGTLSVNSVDVGKTLIAEGLAARYQCGRYSCPPQPRNWCSG
jgi:micrococcal nuclease